ncbi:inositol monophosphatase family protein [Brevibacterium sediminis]|uniref:inositol monophosphatase family protein n=1 Tax=Brevibacterium sediminis TaxID=1857024 RepID=UPI0028700DFD|nr:inositol monophosphatase family protein [Brevibacterium sediminis]MCS4592673.1 inositol monophosphatase family protein [Brevibacterium sediminis]
MKNELTFMIDLVRLTSAYSSTWDGELNTCSKPDGSPVTSLDLILDEIILFHIRNRWPDDSILSEEAGVIPGSSTRTWVIDPLDGTSRYIRGEPSWGTHVSLMEHDKVILGAISRPILGKLIWAKQGSGSHLMTSANAGGQVEQLMRVSTIGNSSEARVVGLLEGGGSTERTLVSAAVSLDLFSDFAVEDLAMGRADALFDDGGKLWDQAPASLIVREAGGYYSDIHGGMTLDSGYGVYSNGVLHPWALSLAKKSFSC